MHLHPHRSSAISSLSCSGHMFFFSRQFVMCTRILVSLFICLFLFGPFKSNLCSQTNRMLTESVSMFEYCKLATICKMCSCSNDKITTTTTTKQQHSHTHTHESSRRSLLCNQLCVKIGRGIYSAKKIEY